MIERLRTALTDKKVLERKRVMETISKEQYPLPTTPFSGKPTVDLGGNTYSDCEFFENSDKKNGKNVFSYINTCSTRGGASVLASLLSCPTSDTNALNERASIIQSIGSKVNEGFGGLAEKEEDVLWAFNEHGEHLEDLFDTVYFRFFVAKKLNTSANALTSYNTYRMAISPLAGILSPIIYFVIPYIIIRTKFKINVGFFSYLRLMFATLTAGESLLMGGNNSFRYMKIVSCLFSLLFYFQGVFNSVEISRTLYRVTKHICQKIESMASYLRESLELIEKLWDDRICGAFCIDESMLVPIEKEREYVSRLSFGWDFGRQLREYKNIDKPVSLSILYKSYVLDAIASVARFKEKGSYCHPSYLGAGGGPVLEIEGLRHPCLDSPVENSITLGGGKKPANAILTACNSAGKSVFIKSLLINAILCQTVAVSCSTSCKATAFDHVSSQISVPDCTGYESLFEAEMHRCKKNLDYMKSLGSERLSLIIMDEIFNSTNPYEGISSAYSVCKKLASYRNNALVFTTHFNYLTKLAKDTGLFTNYKMEVIKEGEDIRFTYKLKRGVNRHYLALEILRKNGFDSDVLEDALKIKNSFLS